MLQATQKTLAITTTAFLMFFFALYLLAPISLKRLSWKAGFSLVNDKILPQNQ